MSVFLIIAGFAIARFGARLFVAGEANGGQGPSAGLVTLVVQVVGLALLAWGVVRLLF